MQRIEFSKERYVRALHEETGKRFIPPATITEELSKLRSEPEVPGGSGCLHGPQGRFVVPPAEQHQPMTQPHDNSIASQYEVHSFKKLMAAGTDEFLSLSDGSNVNSLFRVGPGPELT